MGYLNADVYYNPEAFGLEQVAEIDYSSGSYEFDLRIVWRHRESGQLYTARDAGCSCPTPFEAYGALSDLETFSLSAIEDEVRKEVRSEFYTGDDIMPFLEKIRTLERERHATKLVARRISQKLG